MGEVGGEDGVEDEAVWKESEEEEEERRAVVGGEIGGGEGVEHAVHTQPGG